MPYTLDERLRQAKVALADLEKERDAIRKRLEQSKAAAGNGALHRSLAENIGWMRLVKMLEKLDRRVEYQKDLIYDLEQEIIREFLDGKR